MAFNLPQLEQQYKTANVIELSRQNLLHNYDLLKKLGPGEIIPVIKGNAYGHGLHEVGQILADRESPLIAVDSLFEAHVLRRNNPEQQILIMGHVPETALTRTSLKHTSYVLQDKSMLPAFTRTKWHKYKLHLQINTGMQRQGIEPEELDECLEVISKNRHIELEGVMSHLAEADNVDNAVTQAQVDKFDQIVDRVLVAGFEPSWIHLAQTPGVAKVKSKHTNAIRPGVGLFGINPYLPEDPERKKLDGLKPVLKLTSKVIKLHDLKSGDKVSYGGTFKADKDLQVAVIPIGYYEGVRRDFSNATAFKSPKGEHAVVGRICMNHTILDVTDQGLELEDEVEVIGRDRGAVNSVESHCVRTGVFSYELLCKLDPTVYRWVSD